MNHSIQFVDPATGVHTNTQEEIRAHVKKSVVGSTNLELALVNFMFMRRMNATGGTNQISNCFNGYLSVLSSLLYVFSCDLYNLISVLLLSISYILSKSYPLKSNLFCIELILKAGVVRFKVEFLDSAPTLYESYAQTTHFLQISAQYILNCGLCGQIIAKKELNCPYLSSRHLRKRSLQIC